MLCSDRDETIDLGLAGSRNVTADLDADGVLDLITAAPRGSLSITWGQSDQREYRVVPGGVADVAVADVDGDGDQDVVYATREPGMLRVLDNVGGRTLPEGRSVGIEGTPQSLWVGAIDGDASPDAVVADPDGLTVVTQGLTHSERMMVGTDITEVEVGDLDGDGRGDIVAVDRGEGAFWVVQAQGEGFAPPRRIATGRGPEYLELYDLDGDGSLDVLTHGAAKRDIWLHPGDGAGGFAVSRGIVVQDEPSLGFGAHRDAQGGRWLLTVDGEGVVASQLGDDDRVVGRVLANDNALATALDVDGGSVLSHGPFRVWRYSLELAQVFVERWHGGESSLQPLVFGDFDLDGALELAHFEDNYRVVIRKMLPDGQWVEHSTFMLPQYALSMGAADVTGDGILDLTLGVSGPSVQVAVGRGDGTFELGPPAAIEPDPWLMHTGFDPVGDGTMAVAVANNGPEDPGVFVLHFDAAGVVTGQTQPITEGWGVQLSSADVDKDGRDDLVAVVGEDAGFVLSIVPGVDGGWGAPQSRPLSALVPDLNVGRAALAVGDIDGDGTVDAVLVMGDRIIRLFDIGAAVPPHPQILQVPGLSGGYLAAIGEVDGDGRLDLVYCWVGEFGAVLDIAGDDLRAQTPFDSFINVCTLHVDPGDQRVTAGTIGDRGVSVFTPALAPSLDPTDLFVGGPGAPRRLATGDIDADGQTDVVVADDGSNPVAKFAVLWGQADGAARRGRSVEVYYGNEAEITVAPIDACPGDEIVAVWAGGYVTVWTHRDGALELMRKTSLTTTTTLAVDVQARAGASSDIVVLGRATAEELRVHAVAPGHDAEYLEEVAVLWTGTIGATEPAIAVADLDLDGYEDLVVHPGRGQPVQVAWGNLERVPMVDTIAVDATTISRIDTADMDGDGAPEIILGTSEDLRSIAFDGRVAGEPVVLAEGEYGDDLVIADLEGDGMPDILRTDYNGLGVILRALGEEVRMWLSFHFAPWSQVHAAPLDDDGILDLVGLRDGAVVIRRSGEMR